MSASTKQNSIYLQFVFVPVALVSVRVMFCCGIESENPVFGFHRSWSLIAPLHQHNSERPSPFSSPLSVSMAQNLSRSVIN